MIDGSTQDFSANCNNDNDVDIGGEIKKLNSFKIRSTSSNFMTNILQTTKDEEKRKFKEEIICNWSLPDEELMKNAISRFLFTSSPDTSRIKKDLSCYYRATNSA